jgi:hypothetical protein
MAARWGGEEFALVLPETSLNDAMVVAERIRSSMYAASLIVPQGKTLSFQVSIGVSSAAADEQVGLDELLNQADAALYHAKRTGRNRVCSASDVPPEDLPTAVSPDNIYEKSLPGSSHLLARIGRLHDELHIIAQELGTLLETLLTPEQRAMVETVRQRSLALIDLLGDVSIESGETPQ